MGSVKHVLQELNNRRRLFPVSLQEAGARRAVPEPMREKTARDLTPVGRRRPAALPSAPLVRTILAKDEKFHFYG
jgi:hypothetical protein